MSVSHQYFNSTYNFDVTVKSLLLGFTRPENLKNSTCTNVVVFGTTEASANAYVSNLLKAKLGKTVQCVGVDSKPHGLRGHGFSGYIVMLPELQYVGNAFISNFIDLFEVLQTANCGKLADGDYKDLQVIFANRQIEAAFFGAMFERWKTHQEFQNKWHFDSESPMFSRSATVGVSSAGGSIGSDFLGFGTDDDYGDSDPDARIAPPTIIDLGKVVSILLAKGNEHYRVNPSMHPIRFGPEFCSLSADQLRNVLYKFDATDSHQNKRTVCLHDSVAKKLFLDGIRPDICVGTIYGYGDCGIDAPPTKYVPIDDFEFTKPKVKKVKTTTPVQMNVQIGDNGSITLNTPGEVVVNT